MSGPDLPGGDERFADWLDGRMNARDLERFEAELRVNPDLRRRAEQYRRTVESVQQALRAPLPKIDVADAVLQRIATAPQQSSPLRPTPWHGASRSAVWLSAGVAAALFVGMLLLFQWQPAPERTTLAQTPAPTVSSPTPPAEQPDAGLLTDGKQEAGVVKQSLDELVEQKVVGAAKEQAESSLTANSAGESELAKDAKPALRRVQAPESNPPSTAPVAPKPADDAVPAGRRDADAEERQLPSFDLASTTVPEVRLRRAAASGEAVPQEQTAGAYGAMAFFTLGAQDLGAVFPPGGLQMQRLPLEQLNRYRQVGYVAMQDTPAAPTVQADRPQGATVPGSVVAPQATIATAGEAWLIEGTSPEVFHYLEQLSTAGRACGFEVVNGEVPTNEVALLTIAAGGGEAGAGSGATGRDDLLLGFVQGATEQDKAPPGSANPEAKAKGQPTTGVRKSDQPVAAEKARSAPAFGERGAESADRAAVGGGAKAGAPPGGPSSPSPVGPAKRSEPSGSPTPTPAPDPAPPRVRVLVVIDRSDPQRR